ncbi:MAG: hypothetical protein OQL19_17400, partial [Gammaproteobacteria bacterium]|nr:hypothetical protein [Gammaproteobacteria bacterium]
MDTKFNVVYAGLKDGVTAEEFIAKFCDKFGISEEKAQKIVSSTSDVVIKKDLDEAKAKKYASAFESCGIVARLDEIAEESGGLSLEPIAGEKDAEEEVSSVEVCPKCGSERIENDECLACGIYISKYLEKQESASIQYDEDPETPISHNQTVNEDDDSTGNPYATPEAPLEKNVVSKEGQGSVEGGINGDYDFTISEIFSEAWERTKGAK